MDHFTFAALGFAFIGLIATGVIYVMTLNRVSDPIKRRNALRWVAAFGLSLCTFMGSTPLLGQNQIWILVLPLVGTWLSLDSLHRIGESAMAGRSKLASNQNAAS